MRLANKRFRLRWINSKNGEPSYLAWGNDDFYVSHNPDNPETWYFEAELNELKRQIPHLAPAIEAMKEEMD